MKYVIETQTHREEERVERSSDILHYIEPGKFINSQPSLTEKKKVVGIIVLDI